MALLAPWSISHHVVVVSKYNDDDDDGHMIQLWNHLTRSYHHLLGGHSGRVTAVTLSSDSRFLASGSYSGAVRIWDLATGSAHLIEAHSAEVSALAFSPDSRFLASVRPLGINNA